MGWKRRYTVLSILSCAYLLCNVDRMVKWSRSCACASPLTVTQAFSRACSDTSTTSSHSTPRDREIRHERAHALIDRRLLLIAEKFGQSPCVLNAYWHYIV